MTAAQHQANDRADAVAYATGVARFFPWDDFWKHHDSLVPTMLDLLINDGLTQDQARSIAMQYARSHNLPSVQRFALAVWADAFVFGYYADPEMQQSSGYWEA